MENKLTIQWRRLGEFIVPKDEVNKEGRYSRVMGLNAQKEFMPTVANLDTVDLSRYKLVKKGWFAFSGMQTGRDECIRIALYSDDETVIISPAYSTFSIDESTNIIPEYIFEYFFRAEMDRYGWFISDSSVRANLDWNRLLGIKIPIPYSNGKPDIYRQQEVVNAWQGLRKMKTQNIQLAQPLFQLCRSFIEELSRHCSPLEISQFIEETNERNAEGKYKLDSLRGLSIEKKFIDSKANMDGVSLLPYKIVKPRHFCFVTITSRNSEKITIAQNTSEEDYIVSSSYVTFKIKDVDKLNPDFLMLWFKRPEFDRYARFHSWGSAREAFSFDEMKRVKIPIPDIETQKAIVNIYHCAEESKRIAEEADRLSREVCPALMQHIIHES